MNRIKGDLIALALEGRFDLIVHGCNCFNTMGAGIARQIRETFPAAYDADLATVKGDLSKLGTFSQAHVDIGGHSLVIINAYTQFHYAGSGVLADYEAIGEVFKGLKQNFSGHHIAYPKIGAGLAGGDWEVIGQIIDQALAGEDHTLVEFKP